MKRYFLLAAFALFAIVACSKQNTEQSMSDNPLLQDWTTKFGVPPFDKIKTDQFLPAMKEAIKMHDAEIDAICNSKEAPSFKNTIEALDYSGMKLMQVALVFDNYTSANVTDELNAIADEMTTLQSQHADNVSLNEKLFARIKAVYENKDKEKLNPEQARLLEDTYKGYVRNGANLNAKDKETLRGLNEKINNLSLKFSNNMLAATNAYTLVVDKEADLAGLPAGVIAAAKEEADAAGKSGKWVFTLQNPSVMPFLQYSANRDLRKKIWDAYTTRCNGGKFDNNQIIKDILTAKLAKAKLFGFATPADYILDETMAKTPQAAFDLLNKIWTPALNVAKSDLAEMQKIADKDGVKIEAWDWRYYENKLKNQKFNFDEDMVKPYFKLENVREGLFYVINKLFGLTFKPLEGMASFVEGMEWYEVLDKDGSHIAVISFDYFPRASKRGGAWMSNYTLQYIKDGKNFYPYIPLTLNFTKPTKDTPSLLTLDEVETLFHETGHALHGLLSKVTYPSLAGTNVYRDFVELPSQIMENWCVQPEVLKVYAKHYKTGAVIPQELIDKIQASGKFGQGFATTELIAASLLDMKYHTLTDVSNLDPQKFETETLKAIGLIPEIISRYKSSYFNHIFGGGYSAGYYSYTWAEVLDADAFSVFEQKGLFDQATATSFRKNILEKGGSADPMELYKKFRGLAPGPEALLKRRGLI